MYFMRNSFSQMPQKDQISILICPALDAGQINMRVWPGKKQTTKLKSAKILKNVSSKPHYIKNSKTRGQTV